MVNATVSDAIRAGLPAEVRDYLAVLEGLVSAKGGTPSLPVTCDCHQSLVAGEACSDEVIARLGQVGVATLIPHVQRAGVHRTFLTGLVPRTNSQRFAGRATTLRCLPTREDVAKDLAAARHGQISLQFLAYETAGPGQVLVVDARGDINAAVGGDLLVARLKARGAAALVTDGAIRDLHGIQQVDLPVYTRGVQAATFSESHVAIDLNVPVQCAGVLVRPGDILVGDPEGVLVIPPQVATQIAAAAIEDERRDSFLMTQIMAGEPLEEAFPPRERVLAEYNTWLKQQGP